MVTPKRKPGRPKGPPTVPICIRMPVTHHAEYIKQGGAEWIKALIAKFIAGN